MSRPRSLSRGWLFLFPALNSVTHHLAIAEPLRCTQDLVCRSHLDQGVALDLAGKYEPALREFQAAYQRQKDPRMAMNIGRTLHKLGRFSEALSWYKDAGRAAGGWDM
jgi:tetratricopeptide (TPR) repeat protein